MNMMTPEEYKKWYESTTDKQRMESDYRIAEKEYTQENPIKPKLKIKPKRDTVIPGKGGKGNYAKGGEVKGYMGGGSVHKNKNKMLTTKGWGASRKT
jgi:hypothetical protein